MKLRIIWGLIFTGLTVGSYGQTYFGEVETITTNNENGYARPRIEALENGAVFVLWGDKSKSKMYGGRYDNGSWSINELNPIGSDVFTTDWAGPEMAVKGNNVIVTFKALPENQEYVYSMLSQDGGKNFIGEVKIDSSVWTRFPTPSFDHLGNPYVAFMEFDSAFLDPHYSVSYSMDGGNSYGVGTAASVFAPGEACDCCPAHVMGEQNNVFLFFRNNDNNLRDMWVVKSENSGVSFDKGDDIDMNNWMINSCPSTGPDAIQYGDSLLSVWMSAGSGSPRINFAMVDKANLVVGSKGELSSGIPSSSNQNYPRIAGSGDTIGVVWQESGGGRIQVLGKFSSSGLDGLIGADVDTISSASVLIQGNPDISYTSGVFHIVWQNNIDRAIHYRKASLNSWLAVEPERISEDILVYPNPAQDQLFVSFPDFTANVQFEIIDLQGRLQKSGILSSGESRINISALSSGNYLLRFRGFEQALLKFQIE